MHTHTSLTHTHVSEHILESYICLVYIRREHGKYKSGWLILYHLEISVIFYLLTSGIQIWGHEPGVTIIEIRPLIVQPIPELCSFNIFMLQKL